MGELLTRSRLLCPACEYDVEQTLRDGLAVCPECGGSVSEATCLVLKQMIPRRWFVWLLPASMSPTIVPLFAVALHLLTGWSGWYPLAFIVAIAAVYAAWAVVERRLEPRASRWLVGARALGWLVVFLVLNSPLASCLLSIAVRSL